MEGEAGYLNLMAKIIASGDCHPSRAGPVRSIFGAMLEFNLVGASMPLLTTKQVWWRGVAEELVFFMHGDTDYRILANKGVHIWDANGSRDFLNARGLDYHEGDLGPIYGWQWRHSGARYLGPDAQHGGVDQLAEVIHGLCENPHSRRFVVSAWNPSDIPLMALPPCHIIYQFYASGDKYLDCMMYQRSADMPLGVPFNIASYALLTHIVAAMCGREARRLIISFGNAHIYENQIETARMQIGRTPFSPPQLAFMKQIPNMGKIAKNKRLAIISQFLNDIDTSYFKLVNYKHQGKLDYQFNV